MESFRLPKTKSVTSTGREEKKKKDQAVFGSGKGLMVSEEGLKEFIKIYQEEFGILLTNEGALEKAIPVLNLVKTLVKPKAKLPIDEAGKGVGK